jgi:hypothetical protein
LPCRRRGISGLLIVFDLKIGELGVIVGKLVFFKLSSLLKITVLELVPDDGRNFGNKGTTVATSNVPESPVRKIVEDPINIL